MTARTILTLAPRLSLTEDEIQSYVRGANGRRRRFSMSHENYAPIVELDNVSEQLDWVHLALLAMFDLKGFNPETSSINQRLDFPCEKLEVLLTDLAAMKLIAKSEDGTWCKEKNRYSICSRKFPRVNHVKRQILEQAAIMIPENFGDHSAMTFAISEARIPEANNRIIKFRRELAEFLHESDDKDHVYHLSISLFPAIKNLR